MFNKLSGAFHDPSSKFRKIATNIIWLLIDRVLAMGTAFLVSVVVARYLGPDKLGILKYVTAFVFLFSPLSTLGMSNVVIRELVQDPSAKNEILGTAFFLRLICGISTALLTIIAVLFLSPNDAEIRILVAIFSSVFLFNAFGVIDDWFNSQVAAKYIVFSKNIALFSLSAVKIYLVQCKAPLILFISATVLETVVYSMMLFIFYSKNNQSSGILGWKMKWSKAKYLLKESFPLLLNGIVVSIYLMIDQVMLGKMVGNSAVGTYSVAVSLSEMWYMLPVILSSSFYPSIIQLKDGDPVLYQKRLQQYYDLMTLLAYCVIIFFIPISRLLIPAVYGAAYEPSIAILCVHILTCPFNFIGIAQSTWLTSEGLQKFNFYASALGAICNVLLNLLLIPQFSGIGAAIATLISYAGASYVFYMFFPETNRNSLLMTKSLFLPFRAFLMGFKRFSH
jgi:polysaccharide transporter, PST family